MISDFNLISFFSFFFGFFFRLVLLVFPCCKFWCPGFDLFFLTFGSFFSFQFIAGFGSFLALAVVFLVRLSRKSFLPPFFFVFFFFASLTFSFL